MVDPPIADIFRPLIDGTYGPACAATELGSIKPSRNRERTVKPNAETDHRRDPRRGGQRSLGAAEGVLVALPHCSLDEAFNDIVQTAKRHNVAPLRLADALVAVAANHVTRDFDDTVVAAVAQAWGALLGRPATTLGREHAQQPQPTVTVCTSSRPPKLSGANDDRANPACR